MTKITHIFKTYFPETNGGLEEAIRQIGRLAIKEEFEVEVVTVGKRSYEMTTPDGITARFHKCSLDLYSNPVSRTLAKEFKAICRNTDILHFHFTWPTAELLTLLHRVTTPMVVTFHCDIHKNKLLKALYLPVAKQFLNRADRICVTSKNLLEATPWLHEFKHKTEEIPLWFDENRFAGLPAPQARITDFTKAIKPYGLFVGVLRWYKGLDTLLDASRNFRGDIVIVGKGPLYNHLRKRIEEERLTNVHLMGFQSDSNLKFLIQQSRFIVLPSLSPAEAFGQILLEGLYFSKPLISTELGTGTSLVNRHGHTGLVVPPNSSRSLAGAMNRILNDQCLYEKFAANSFRHYKANFTETAQGSKYTRIYRSLEKKRS
ncbi:MAG: glycosyltransferase [Desulfobacteraceae bacterium]|nr:glycosyltransferase [Desulfobacteraceae bacterium]